MKKTSFLVALLCIGSMAFSLNGTDPVLLKIASLKLLSEKTELQTQKLKETATSSRAANAEAKTALIASYNDYVAELKKQRAATTDANLQTAIDKELQIVAEKLSALTAAH